MARMAVTGTSGTEKTGPSALEQTVRLVLFALHFVLILYIGLGWLIPSRNALFLYTLLLPLIAIQWLLNGGASIVNNIENLVLSGKWSDPRNLFEGAFFRTLLHAVGVPASQAQITTALCFLMLIFWIAAICHMILIVVPAG
jgi:hypothetical protein